jgi:hypothetical protein
LGPVGGEDTVPGNVYNYNHHWAIMDNNVSHIVHILYSNKPKSEEHQDYILYPGGSVDRDNPGRGQLSKDSSSHETSIEETQTS